MANSQEEVRAIQQDLEAQKDELMQEAFASFLILACDYMVRQQPQLVYDAARVKNKLFDFLELK